MRKRKRQEPPPGGGAFHHRYKGEVIEMTVVANARGIGYRVCGHDFNSPTAAAKFVVGCDQFVNGWRFWNMEKIE